MGVMDKFLNYMKLNDEEDDGYYDDDYYDDEDSAPADSGRSKIRSISKNEPAEEEDRPRKSTPKVTPMRPAPRKVGAGGMEVCVIGSSISLRVPAMRSTATFRRSPISFSSSRLPAWIFPAISRRS